MRKTFILLITIALVGCSTLPALAAITEATPRSEYTAAGGDTYQCADTGDASQGWPIWVKTDLRVWLDATLQTVDTDYTVNFTAGDDSDCEIVFVVTPSNGQIVTMERAIDQERASDFATSGPFSMASMNSTLDYVTTLAQDNAVRINRTARLDPGEEIATGFSRLPSPTALYVLGYDSTGNYVNYAFDTGSGWDGLTDLADNSVGKGSDLVAHTGTADNVTEALGKKLDLAGGTLTGTVDINDATSLTPLLRFVDTPNDSIASLQMGSELLKIAGYYNGGAVVGTMAYFDLSDGKMYATSIGALSPVLTQADEGHTNGLDADTVDGFHGSATIGELLGDGTAGRVVRNSRFIVQYDTATTLTALMEDQWNGDSDTTRTGIAKGGTVGIFSLNASGTNFSFTVTGDCIAVLSVTMNYDTSTAKYDLKASPVTGDVVVNARPKGSSSPADWTTVFGSGEAMQIEITYVTDQ